MKEFNYEAAKNGAPVRTRDGRPARIIYWDRKDPHYPIIALVTCEGGHEYVYCYTIDGHFWKNKTTDNKDLVMAPVKKEGWINIYPNNLADGMHNTQEEADEKSGETRVACVRVEWEE